jgi:uncharacterized damage-inducible protein DinB
MPVTPFDFLVDSYRTERLKILSLWAQVPADQMTFRPEPRARTPLEHMVHQCLSEDAWMTNMLGVPSTAPALPAEETRDAFVAHYGAVSAARAEHLSTQSAEWFAAPVRFFDVERARAWVLTRRMTHSAHHRGQLTVYFRLWGQALYSTYGPTADTGGLAKNGATVVYFTLDAPPAPLPGPGDAPVSERPTARPPK